MSLERAQVVRKRIREEPMPISMSEESRDVGQEGEKVIVSLEIVDPTKIAFSLLS